MNFNDWTDYFDRGKIIDDAHNIIDEIIQSIHSQNFPIHTQYKLTIDELALIYRWPIYFAVNTFIERFLRSVYFKEKKIVVSYPKIQCVPRYYSNVSGSAAVYYHDIAINQKLLRDINTVLSSNNVESEKENINNEICLLYTSDAADE